VRILVTGGLGAVGTPLVGILRERGHMVWVLDRAHHSGLNGAYYFRADVGEYRQLQHVFQQQSFDLVYHAAAEFGRINGEMFYETMWRTNVVGTRNMINLQEEYQFRMVAFSSSEIYGDWNGPMTEDVPNHHPVRQLNDYAISKWVNEMQVANSTAAQGTETVIIRLFNTYGPGETYSEYRSVICRFIYCALHNLPYTVYLDHHRTSTYIDDAATTLANIADRFRPCAVYNIAGARYHDIKSLSDLILGRCGRSDALVTYVEREAHNTRDKLTTADLARRELGHKESVSLEEGIERTIAWQKKIYGV
jgi:dTDP-glucose 4,6-dehydratase